MNRRLIAATGVALAVCLQAQAAPAQEPDPADIVRTVRSLFAMQDAVAAGNPGGLAGQRGILAALKGTGGSLPAGTVPETAVAHALAAYVLSGGQPERAEAYAELPGLASHAVHMLKGSAAFMRGDPETARAHLAGVDPLRLPPAYGGRIALTRAMLADPATGEREDFLSKAMALMPGTLVEEAALRRLAQTHAEQKDVTAFWKRTDRYVRRFRSSLYAPDFVSGIAGHAIAFHRAGKPARLDRLDIVFAAFPVAQRRQLYLQMARQAAARNAPDLTRFAGRRLVRLATEGSLEQLQGQLHSWAHAIAGPEQEQAWRHLRAIDASRLDATDRALLEAALTLIAQIEADPDPPGPLATVADEAQSTVGQIESRIMTLLAETGPLAGEP